MKASVTDKDSIKAELHAGSTRLYFLFGGIQGGVAMPPFEFYSAAGVLEFSKVFIRDFRQAWYQQGLPELGSDIAVIADYLRRTIEESQATEVRFVGNSMGGFAALMFCALLQTGRAVAFAPQTFISAKTRRAHGDTRWAAQIQRVHENLRGGEILELRPFIQQQYPDIEADIYVSKADTLDLAHAGQLTGLRNVAVHEFGVGGHNLVRHLRDAGMLSQILA